MRIVLKTPGVGELPEVVEVLGSWQREDGPIQLHPGDLGWYWRHGAPAAASAMRVWRQDGTISAVGLLDGRTVLRLGVAPERWLEEELADRVGADVADPARGVLPPGQASVEVPDGTRLQESLATSGFRDGEAWSPFRLELRDPIEGSELQVEVVESAQQVDLCTAVHRAAWGSSHFTDEVWQAMAGGTPFADARCLLGRDPAGVAVATVTAWSAGPGRPGLLEPLGVHPEHRRRGHGAAIVRAAADQLRALGSTSVLVCTPSSLDSAVATYRAAGFDPLPERLDRTRAG